MHYSKQFMLFKQQSSKLILRCKSVTTQSLSNCQFATIAPILSQKNVLSVEEYNKKVKILEESIKDKNSEVAAKNNEFLLFKKKIETLFSKKLNSVIEEYSLENSINIILNKENLLMAKKNLDITQQVFSIFNERVNKIDLN